MLIPGVLEALAAGDLCRALELTGDEVCRNLVAHESVLAWLARSRVQLQLGAYPEAREAASLARKVALHGGYAAEACQAYLALAAGDLALGDFSRAELSLEKASEIGKDSPAACDACAAVRGEIFFAQGRLDEFRSALGPAGSPLGLLRLRLEIEEERWADAAATWEQLPAMTDPDAILQRLLLGARIARARDQADRAAVLQAEAEALAARWVESLPGARRGPFAARLRGLGVDVQTESSVTPIPRPLSHPLAGIAGIAPETRVLAEVIKRMNAETRLPPLLDLILDSALGLCGGDYGYLVVLEGERTECRVARHEHRRPPDPAELALSRRIAEGVARRSGPFVSTDARADASLDEFGEHERAAVRALACVPMRIQDRPIGSIYLHSTAHTSLFGEREVEIARILADQAALAIERSVLLSRSVRDPLTSLFNHSYLEQQLDQEVDRCGRHQRTCSLLLVDLDKFKHINDTYGHEFGTRVIREMSTVIEGSLRSSDTISRHAREGDGQRVVARYGGDEFEILLPETPRAGAMLIANRLIEKARKRVFRAAGQDVTVDLSVGVASFPEDAKDAQELFLHADEALYEAKRSGRGCAVSWQRRASEEYSEEAEWEELLQDPYGRRLLAVLPQILTEGAELSRALPRALEKIVQAVQAQTGFLFALVADRAPELVATWPAGAKVDPARLDLTALAHSLRSGKPILLSNVRGDKAAPTREGAAPVEVGSDLCLPLPIRADYKVVFALERTAGTREFRAQDLPLFEAFGRRLAQALRVGRIVEEKTSELARLHLVLDQGLRELERRHDKDAPVGRSEASRTMQDQIRRFAPSPYPVLLMGEPGTEKERTARAIHYASPRREQPMLAVRCLGVPPDLLLAELFGTPGTPRRIGLLEAAAGGTLFLDDVDALPAAAQEQLLHALTEGEVRSGEPIDVRVLAGTTRDLDTLALQGTFHPELLARLRALAIAVPPLRARREDIADWVEHLLERIACDTGEPRRKSSREALRILVSAPWPGNVAELESVLRQAVSVSETTLQTSDLPESLRAARKATGDVSRTSIRRIIQNHDGDLRQAARELGLSRTDLLRRMKQLGIEAQRRP